NKQAGLQKTVPPLAPRASYDVDNRQDGRMNDADEDDAADNNFGLIQCATEMLQSACRVEEDLRARTGFAGTADVIFSPKAGGPSIASASVANTSATAAQSGYARNLLLLQDDHQVLLGPNKNAVAPSSAGYFSSKNATSGPKSTKPVAVAHQKLTTSASSGIGVGAAAKATARSAA
ncbi:unnamed protein product, partial [Amoebophrya sp. A120]